MRLELGGGSRAKDGFVNMDLIETADIQHDLDSLPWPIRDDAVEELYSSHCIEHLRDPNAVLVEIARICRPGAKVVLRVPATTSDGAMCPGHLHVLGETWFRNAVDLIPLPGFAQLGKRLLVRAVRHRPDPIWFPRARQSRLFTGWTDEEIMVWLPHTCHETEFELEVARA
jgi:SAM-dependent methyltransferase